MKNFSIAIFFLSLIQILKVQAQTFTWANDLDKILLLDEYENQTAILPDYLRKLRVDNAQSLLVALACKDDPTWPAQPICESQIKPVYYFRALRNYGCNCYNEKFDRINPISGKEQMHFGSSGVPVDDLDAACLKAYNNYKCLQQDMKNGELRNYNEDNVPHEDCYFGMPFEYHIDKSSNRKGGIICGPEDNPRYKKNKPQDVCKLYSCIIERDFAVAAFNIIGKRAGEYADANPDKYNHVQDGRCVRKGNGAHERNSCCGHYPSKLPYDKNRHDCCDGVVTPFGGC